MWPWPRPLREHSLITRLRLYMADTFTKFEVSSVSRCGDFTWVSWPWPPPFQGRFFIGRVGLAMVSQCTKLEVSRFTRYEAMNGGAKCRKSGGLGQLGGTVNFDRVHTTSYLTLIVTMCLSFTVFEIEPAICRKSPILTHPTCIRRYRRGWRRSNFAEIFGGRKLESLGYRVVLFVWSSV